MAPLVILALGWVSGIWAAAQFNWPWWAWLAPATLAGLALARWRRSAWVRWPLALLVCLGLGGVRGRLAQPVYDATFVASYVDQGPVTVVGVVNAEPDVRDPRVNLRLSAETLLQPGQEAPRPVHGDILISAPRSSEERRQTAGDPEYHYGDRLSVTGLLITPPASADFSYQDYLAEEGIYAQLPQAQVTFLAAHRGNPVLEGLLDFKARAGFILGQIFPEPHAALLSSILLGVHTNLPPDVKDAFSATGTSHVIVVSGFKVTLLASLLTFVLSRVLGARRGLWLVILGVAAYAALAGGGPSVARAAAMASLALVAQQIGRRGFGLSALAAAVFLVTFWNPLALWEAGFQLSAAATLGVVLYVEPLEARLVNWATRFTTPKNARRIAAWLGGPILITLAAQVTALPLTTLYFKSISLVSLLANLLILPAQPPLIVLAELALAVGLVAPPLGLLVGWPARLLSAYTLALVRLLAGAPSAAIYLGEVTPWLAGAYYATLFGLTWIFRRPADQRPAWWKALAANWVPAAGLGALAIGVVVVWGTYLSVPDGRLKVAVLDVGQGDAVLIQTPGGANVLVDGGPSGGALNRALGSQLPLFARDLDLLVVAAPSDENLGGLPEMLRRYTVRRAVVTQATDAQSLVYPALMQQLKSGRIDIMQAADGLAIDLGDGVSLRVLSDDKTGSALRLEWKRFALLLPVGLRQAGETALLSRGDPLPATALLLADHGSERADSEAWLRAVDPRVALISVGAGNPAGDPAPAVLGRLEGRTVLRTDQSGTLTLFTDGEQLWVETER
jgi:competence protein ComEC